MATKIKNVFRKRLLFLGFLFLLLLIAIFSRAFHLQVLSSDALKNKAKKQHTAAITVDPERGIIYDRNGEKLAISVMAKSVVADPTKIVQPAETARKLATILQVDKNVLLKQLVRESNFAWLARRIRPEQASEIEKLDLPGVYFVDEPKRFYPNGAMAAHILGFVGSDSNGLEGIEFKYNSYLKGAPRHLIWTRDAKGNKRHLRLEKSALEKNESHSLVLTINSQIQFLVESHLKEAVQSKGAKGGMAIVMNPKTGEVLALANEPGFDPNNFLKTSKEVIRNKIIVDSFDPGSIFKPFLAAAALEEGIIKETDKLYCERGQYIVADRVIREANRKSFSYLSFVDIMKFSSNIGFVKIAEKLGKDKFYEYITGFGFGAETGIDLPGEASGILRPPSRWTRVDTAAISFGQGISVTAIQMISAFSAIANNGQLVKPYLVKAIVDNNGRVVKEFVPNPVRRVVSARTAKRLSDVLSQVVTDDDGTGTRARIDLITVAGKTGTAQKFDFGRRKYSNEKVKSSFIGFFPVEDPKIAILVVLDEPKRDKWGGMAAAPVFQNIGEQILTRVKTNIRKNPVEREKIEDIRPAVKLQYVSHKPLLASASLLNAEANNGFMPDFRGLTIRDVLRIGRRMGIEVKIIGSGWAVYQEPAPGAPLGSQPRSQVSFRPGY